MRGAPEDLETREAAVEQVFVRFGAPPKSGRSRDHYTGRAEAGVSVFLCSRTPEGAYIFDPGEDQALMCTWYVVCGRPAFEVRGREVGVARRSRGSAREPVLADVEIVRRVPAHALRCTRPKPPLFGLIKTVAAIARSLG